MRQKVDTPRAAGCAAHIDDGSLAGRVAGFGDPPVLVNGCRGLLRDGGGRMLCGHDSSVM